MAASKKNVGAGLLAPDARSSLASALDQVGKSPPPISPLLDISCDWIMREAAFELLQLPHLNTPDNHLFKAARAAAASVAGTRQFMNTRSVEKPGKNSGLLARRGRKRISRQCATPVANLVDNKYVMTLFDRSIDLAQHTEGTPLYVMCRSWIGDIRQPSTDAPSLEMAGISPCPDSKANSEVWTLPMPSPPAATSNDSTLDVDATQDGSTVSSSSVASSSSTCSNWSDLERHLVEQSSPVSGLMTEHLASWKQCRRVKMKLERLRSKRHSKSMGVLKSIRKDILNSSTSPTQALASL